MHVLARLACSAALLAIASVPATASTLVLDSNSSSTAYYGYSPTYNLAGLVPASDQTTYNIGTGGVWAGPIGSSSWVSFNPNTYPGGSYVAPAGTYVYFTFFNDTTPDITSGTITLLADDTTSVYLNNLTTPLIPDAPAVPAPHCTVGTPNCATEATYTLSGFVYGSNLLVFGVNQDFGSATGLDYQATINTTPEPSSLALLATGLSGVAGLVRRRLRA